MRRSCAAHAAATSMRGAALLIAGLALVGAAPAFAGVAWDVYGRADLSVDRYSAGGYDAWDLASNSSRAGLAAVHELDAGLTVTGRIERKVVISRGEAELEARDTYLGLGGEWGELRLGYLDTALKDIRSRVDLFGSQMGNARNVIRADHDPHLDDRFPTTLRYSSPRQLGWGTELQVSLDPADADDLEDGRVLPSADNERTGVSAALRYTGERFWAAGGYERVDGLDEGMDGSGERDSAGGYRLGIEVDVTDGLRLTALGQITEDAYPEWGAGAVGDKSEREGYVDAVAYGAGALLALDEDLELRLQHYTLDVDASGQGARILSVGPVFHADEHLQLYATATYLSNDDRSRLVPWYQGRTAGADGHGIDDEAGLSPGRSAWGLSSGVRYDF